jgi:predicted nucleotidyltransferase
MESMDSVNLQQLQDEIEPLLKEMLKNPNFIEVLKKYGVLQAVEIQLKLNVNKLSTQNVNKLSTQEFQILNSIWCSICGDMRPRSKCPDSEDKC